MTELNPNRSNRNGIGVDASRTVWRSRLIPGSAAIIAAAMPSILLAAFGQFPWGWMFIGLAATAIGMLALALHYVPANTLPPEGGGGTKDVVIGTSINTGAVLAGIPDPTLLLDSALNVVDANTAALSLFPLQLGRNLALAMRSPDLLQAVKTAIDTRETQNCIVRPISPNEWTLDCRITPIGASGPPGTPMLLVLLRDMSEQQQLSQMRADFVANASHELRTPLASLKGFVETLQTAAKDDPKAREQFLGIMQEQATRMSRLIDDLLSLSRIEMHEHMAPTAKVDLNAVAAEAVAALRPVAEARKVTVKLAGEQGDAKVIGDRDELMQVAQNLVQNAIKYGKTGGRVDVAVKLEHGRALLVVVDDGIGIAPQHLPRLTERFYRVSAKDSRERGGTGLGLAIVKHIVNRHRGALRINSVQGQGSTFTVSLPSE